MEGLRRFEGLFRRHAMKKSLQNVGAEGLRNRRKHFFLLLQLAAKRHFVGVLRKNILKQVSAVSVARGTEFAGRVFTGTRSPSLRGEQSRCGASLGLCRFDFGIESVAAQQVWQVLRKGGAWHYHVTACFHSFSLQVALQVREKTNH